MRSRSQHRPLEAEAWSVVIPRLRQRLWVTHVTSEQRSDLSLNNLGFSQKAFLNRQALHPALAASHVVGLGRLEGLCARQEILGISPDVMALRLDYTQA